MDRLEQILRVKRREIEHLRPRAPELRRRALERTDFRRFGPVLQRSDGKLTVIAEIKRASPSAGVIAKSFDPVRIGQRYEEAGAQAISVLTDEKFFKGKLAYLADVRAAVSLPLLRKDFILDEAQITESVAAGADAILLIVAALPQEQLVRLSEVAATYQLDALVEVHTMAELDRALDANAKIIGINNRDLSTFEINLSVTEQLSERVPDEVVLVSESGVKTMADVARLQACGIDAVLIGEALVRGQVALEDLHAR